MSDDQFEFAPPQQPGAATDPLEEAVAAHLGSAPEVAEEPEEEPQPEFTEEDIETFRTLLTVGFVVKSHTVLGHTVELATTSVDDELRIGLFTKEFRDSDGYARAYQTGMVAASIRRVDGEPFVRESLTRETPEELFARKLEKARGMHPLTVSVLYQKLIEMEQAYAQMAVKLGKL